jgi:hypothetical protein
VTGNDIDDRKQLEERTQQEKPCVLREQIDQVFIGAPGALEATQSEFPREARQFEAA